MRNADRLRNPSWGRIVGGAKLESETPCNRGERGALGRRLYSPSNRMLREAPIKWDTYPIQLLTRPGN